MKLIPAATYTSTNGLIAINPSSYVATLGQAHVGALWFDRKHGNPVTKAGALQIDWDTWMWKDRLDQKENVFTLEELLALDKLDIYHRTEHIWNGTNLWSKTSPSTEEVEHHLVSLYNTNLPAVAPKGWQGWFLLSYENRYCD